MLFKLKISIYYIEGGSSSILKAPLDHYPYILAVDIGLYYLRVLFLDWSLKALFVLFAGPPLYRTLVTPHH
jgi:hypothetical protein